MLVSCLTAISLILPAMGVHAAAWPAPTTAVAASAGGDTQVYASVKVDAEGFGEVGSKVVTRVGTEAEKSLSDAGIQRRAGVDDVIFFVKVTPPPSGEEGYILGIAVSHLGKPILDSVEASCELCVEDELIELVDRELGLMIPEVQAYMATVAAEKEEPMVEEEDGTVPLFQPVDPPPEVDEPKAKIGPKGKIGATLVGVGAAGVVGGVIMAVREPRQRSPLVGYEFVDTRPPGYAVLGIGGALVVTGAVLLILDARARRGGDARSAVTPALGPGTAGLTWSGRF